jgi:very-short-patch-repair endonuclease
MSERARRLRREKGAAERKLWYKLRDFNRHGFQFRQQAPIGPYIADFCDHSAKLIIEVDGAQHGEPRGIVRDRRRTRWLELQGYKVLRFWNAEVLTNIYGVEVAIRLAVGLLEEDDPGEKNVARAPSPLVGEGRGGGEPRRMRGEGRTASGVGIPPTPNPSPRGGGGSARRPRSAGETTHA